MFPLISFALHVASVCVEENDSLLKRRDPATPSHNHFFCKTLGADAAYEAPYAFAKFVGGRQ